MPDGVVWYGVWRVWLGVIYFYFSKWSRDSWICSLGSLFSMWPAFCWWVTWEIFGNNISASQIVGLRCCEIMIYWLKYIVIHIFAFSRISLFPLHPSLFSPSLLISFTITGNLFFRSKLKFSTSVKFHRSFHSTLI